MNEKSTLQQQREQKAQVESHWSYRGKFFSVRSDLINTETHSPQKWEIVVNLGAVAILPLISEDELLLIKQWRRPAKEILIELPAGGLDRNESPMDCAQRELQEETGYKAGKIIPFGGFYTTPGFATEYLHIFLATELTPSPLPQDEHEAIDLFPVRLEEALKMIDRHEIRDGKTIAVLLQYDRLKRK